MKPPHKITLSTRDGKALSFPCAPDEYLLDAAEKADITLPTVCRNGTCGACRGNCSAGNYDTTGTGEHALTPAQRKQGDIVFCRTKPMSDMEVSVESDLAHISAGPVKTFPAEIVGLEDIGGEVRHLTLRVSPDANGEPFPPFEPGQYAEMEIPGTGVWRAYSIANAPNWTGELEFLIRLQPNGRFSGWLRSVAAVGETIALRGPQGTFTLKQGSLNPRFFVCGGTGLAPMFSMLKLMTEFQDTAEAKLYFGLNGEDDLFCLDDIEALEAALPSLSAKVCVWKATDDWTGFKGNPLEAMQPDLDAALEAGQTPDIYVCGPPALILATEQLVREKGLSPDCVASEKF